MNKLKLFLSATFACALLLVSCDKAEVAIKDLNRGKGTWQIETLHFETYDSSGTSVVSDSTWTDRGEVIFFTSKTLNGLWNYYACVVNLFAADGSLLLSQRCEAFYDETRADLKDAPTPVSGVWTVEDRGRRKQVWTKYEIRGDGSLGQKVTMTLKKGTRNE
jgi:hypothetical protein